MPFFALHSHVWVHAKQKRSLTSLWVVAFSFLGEGSFVFVFHCLTHKLSLLSLSLSVNWLAALTLWAGLLTSKQQFFSFYSLRSHNWASLTHCFPFILVVSL
jgi:hypothetical protein